MIIENHVPFSFMAQLCHSRLGSGGDRLVMNGTAEDVPGPVMLYFPDFRPPLYFDVPGVCYVTQSLEDLPKKIIRIPIDKPRIVRWSGEYGTYVTLRLWHFNLKVSWA